MNAKIAVLLPCYEKVRRKRAEALVVGWVALPVILSALSMLGFACGVTVGRWHAPLALVLSLVLAGGLVEKGRAKTVLLFLAGVLASVAMAGAFVYYTNADAEAYHRPAAVLLANGWNPLRTTEVSELEGMMGGGFRPWHVCFLPRMGWIFGAAFYKWFGFIEVADAVNMLMLLASFVAVRDWLAGFGVKGWVWTLLVCVSPVVANGLWGGSFDSARYSAFLVAATAAGGRRWLTLALGVIAMSSLKFPGVVLGALLFAYAGLLALTDRGRAKEKAARLWRLTAVGLATVAAIFLANASPYLTSLKNHGGPFYPSHSFVASERFEDARNPVTCDFGFMNDDAREVGYFGRLAWAYGSQTLCKAYYAWKLDRPHFDPDFRVNEGVGGFGTPFRVAFWLSLVAWLFVRDRKVSLLMGTILVSVLILPTFYSGYARYVPQFYLFPILAALGVRMRFPSRRLVGAGLLAAVCGYAVALLAYPLSFFALQWIIGVQNLQIIEAARASEGVEVVADRLALRHSFARDFGCDGIQVRSGSPAAGVAYESSYFGFYKCHVPGGVTGLYPLRHQVSNNDVAIKASRNANMVRFFLKEFLPREFVRIPLRAWQVLRLRASQARIWE